MLTPELERLILTQKAEYKQIAIGGSGVGTIPVQTNEKIIITDFTWHPFSDQQLIYTQYNLAYFPVVVIHWSSITGPITIGANIEAVNVVPLVIGTGTILSIDSVAHTLTVEIKTGDFTTINGIQNIPLGISAAIDSITSVAFTPVEDLLDSTTLATASIISDTPSGAAGLSPGTLKITTIVGAFNSGDDITGVTSGAAAVQNGAIVPVLASFSITETILAAIAASVHHLRFLSKGVSNTFNFRDRVDPIIFTDTRTNPNVITFLGFKVGNPIQVHCFICCDQTVQIDIWKFSPSGNVFTQAQPPGEANEPAVPNGYLGAVANPPVITINTGQGVTIKTLGTARDNSAPVPRLKQELVDDIGDLTELSLPADNISYPIVNIGYVLISNSKRQ